MISSNYIYIDRLAKIIKMNTSLNSSDHLNYSSSPQNLRTSTPDLTYKPRVNFHSIESLAIPFSSPYQNQSKLHFFKKKWMLSSK
jgi:hypothetical protein